MKISKIALLVSLCLSLSMVYSVRFLEDTQEAFEVKLRKYNRGELEKIALACEDYSREQSKVKLLGGLHDYINSLTDDDIIKIIYEYSNLYSALKDTAVLEEKAKIEKRPEATTLEAQVKALSRYELVQYALAGEKYDRKQQKKENLLGGLHDYIRNLSNEEVQKIVLNFAEKYPELKKDGEYAKLVKPNVYTLDQFKAKLLELKHDVLAHIAISLDNYDKSKSSIVRIGGLHDYAFRLTDPELIEIICNFTKKWPEVLEEGFITALLRSKDNLVHATIGGFEDYSFKLERADLISCALSAENYDRKKRNIHVLGGLHDYINTLSNENIVKILNDYVHQYPEMRVPGFIEGLAGIPQGGFEYYLSLQSVENLRQLCIDVESYDRKVRDIHPRGGIHDYVFSLSKEQLVSYILNKAEHYPNLRNKKFIESIKSQQN